MIRTLIADDEAPARDKLRRFLAAEDDVELVAEAHDGRTAVGLVRRHRPDLVLLDVRMPGADGFEVVDAIAEVGPHVIFVTAFAEHAVRAFDVGAADYLLKPFDRERFQRALLRARERLVTRSAGPSAETLRRIVADFRSADPADPAETGRPLRRVLVRDTDRGRSYFVPVEEIDWIEADGNYVRLHTRDRQGAGSGPHVLRSTLKALEDRLDSGRFVRISRRAVVNLDRVRVMHDWSHGDRLVVLEDGTELKLSRRYRDGLEEST